MKIKQVENGSDHEEWERKLWVGKFRKNNCLQSNNFPQKSFRYRNLPNPHCYEEMKMEQIFMHEKPNEMRNKAKPNVYKEILSSRRNHYLRKSIRYRDLLKLSRWCVNENRVHFEHGNTMSWEMFTKLFWVYERSI